MGVPGRRPREDTTFEMQSGIATAAPRQAVCSVKHALVQPKSKIRAFVLFVCRGKLAISDPQQAQPGAELFIPVWENRYFRAF